MEQGYDNIVDLGTGVYSEYQGNIEGTDLIQYPNGGKNQANEINFTKNVSEQKNQTQETKEQEGQKNQEERESNKNAPKDRLPNPKESASRFLNFQVKIFSYLSKKIIFEK